MIDFQEIAEKCLKYECQGTFIVATGSNKMFISSSDLRKDEDPRYPYVLKSFARCATSGISIFGYYQVRLFCKNIFII